MTETAKKSVAKKPSQHPAYKDMIAEAIRSLKERNGSSRQKIAKYLEANYTGLGDESSLKRNLKASLKKMVASQSLIQTKGVGASGSFKLPVSAKKPSTAVKKPVAKKVSASKPKKPAAKKPAVAKQAVKKSPAAKKKVSTPKKAVSKSPKKPVAKVAKKPKAAATKAGKSPASKKPKAKVAVKKTAKKSGKTAKAAKK